MQTKRVKRKKGQVCDGRTIDTANAWQYHRIQRKTIGRASRYPTSMIFNLHGQTIPDPGRQMKNRELNLCIDGIHNFDVNIIAIGKRPYAQPDCLQPRQTIPAVSSKVQILEDGIAEVVHVDRAVDQIQNIMMTASRR